MQPWTEYGGFKRPSGREQQGVLFRASPAEVGMPAEHQYPRGYTPERLRAVSTAIPEGTVGVATGAKAGPFAPATHDWFKATGQPPTEQDERVAEHRRSQGELGAVAENRRWTRPQSEIIAQRGEVTRRRIIDTVARSRMPAADMANMPTFDFPGAMQTRQGMEVRGDYSHPGLMRSHYGPEPSVLGGETQEGNDARYAQAVQSGRVRMAPPSGEGTLLHELGHHVSHQQGTEHSAYQSGRQRGEEEAFADDYAQRMHVPRRGQPALPNESAYADPSTWRSNVTFPEDAGPAHYAYRNARQTLPQPPPPPGSRASGGQARLFQRPVDSMFTDTEKDYGQWGYQNSAGEKLDTVGLPPPPREKRMTSGHPFTPEDLGEPGAYYPRPELSEQTKGTLTKRWGRFVTAGMSTEQAVRHWGREHPELGWQA